MAARQGDDVWARSTRNRLMESQFPMYVLFFDIDGTFIDSRRAGDAAIRAASAEVFGVATRRDGCRGYAPAEDGPARSQPAFSPTCSLSVSRHGQSDKG